MVSEGEVEGEERGGSLVWGGKRTEKMGSVGELWDDILEKRSGAVDEELAESRRRRYVSGGSWRHSQYVDGYETRD